MLRAILLDIEGTTTPMSFVHDVLFPYSRRHLTAFLERHVDSPELIQDLDKLKTEHSLDERDGQHPPPLVESYVGWLIDRDRKSPALKSLQGKIWEAGYKDGSLQAPVFSDVRLAIERWIEEGKTVNIFSSGSVLAQRLLFAHTDHGDLTTLLSKYFDTQVGKKTKMESYQRISNVLSVEPNEVLFISDVVAELDAAADAGMKTALCIRPGNNPQPPTIRHLTIDSLMSDKLQFVGPFG